MAEEVLALVERRTAELEKAKGGRGVMAEMDDDVLAELRHRIMVERFQRRSPQPF
jgi:hypothetical protein